VHRLTEETQQLSQIAAKSDIQLIESKYNYDSLASQYNGFRAKMGGLL